MGSPVKEKKGGGIRWPDAHTMVTVGAFVTKVKVLKTVINLYHKVVVPVLGFLFMVCYWTYGLISIGAWLLTYILFFGGATKIYKWWNSAPAQDDIELQAAAPSSQEDKSVTEETTVTTVSCWQFLPSQSCEECEKKSNLFSFC